MIMGIIILNRKYAFSKYLSVFMITTGIALCTIVSGQEIKSLQQKNVDHVPTTPWDDFFWWILGISLLTIALFISARMGIYQEELHSRYGKHAREALYYTVIFHNFLPYSISTLYSVIINIIINIIYKISLQHFLPLPFFLTLAPNIYDHWKFALASEPMKLPLIGVHMPSLIVYLIGNVLTQYPLLITVSLCYMQYRIFN